MVAPTAARKEILGMLAYSDTFWICFWDWTRPWVAVLQVRAFAATSCGGLAQTPHLLKRFVQDSSCFKSSDIWKSPDQRSIKENATAKKSHLRLHLVLARGFCGYWGGHVCCRQLCDPRTLLVALISEQAAFITVCKFFLNFFLYLALIYCCWHN